MINFAAAIGKNNRKNNGNNLEQQYKKNYEKAFIYSFDAGTWHQ